MTEVIIMFTLILNIYKYLGKFSILIVTKLLNPEIVNHQLKAL